MMLVISPERDYLNETNWVNELLNNGLNLFHVRKPHFNARQMEAYLSKIDPSFRPRLVLHAHYHLADYFNIKRLHFNQRDRLNQAHKKVKNPFAFSTSVHSIEAFNRLESIWRYAFLSPMFPSVSKVGYGVDGSVLKDLKKRNNHRVLLVALGGITLENKDLVLQYGADGIALLGHIWQGNNPLKHFKDLTE